jgi:hypothetical protein
VLFFIDLERRKVFLAGVTEHPIGNWVTEQARNLTVLLEDEGRMVSFLIRDRDTKFVGPFDAEVGRCPSHQDTGASPAGKCVC